MSIGKIRSILYLIAKILGDINAFKRGRIKERIWNRILGKITGRFMR